jgi:hypothetical protein
MKKLSITLFIFVLSATSVLAQTFFFDKVIQHNENEIWYEGVVSNSGSGDLKVALDDQTFVMCGVSNEGDQLDYVISAYEFTKLRSYYNLTDEQVLSLKNESPMFMPTAIVRNPNLRLFVNNEERLLEDTGGEICVAYSIITNKMTVIFRNMQIIPYTPHIR